jgi:hypothetical protein
MNKSSLKDQARRAYEWSRFLSASKFLYIVVPIVLISFATCGSPGLVLLLGVILAALVVLLKWRGQEYGQSVVPGLIAGSAAFVTPLVLEYLDICCEGPTQVILCLASGLVGGLLLGRLLVNQYRRNVRTVAFSIAISGITITLGCASLGVGAIAGIIGALAVATLSSITLSRGLR